MTELERTQSWNSALPEQFAFYHLGNVALQPEADAAATRTADGLAHDSHAIGFSLNGEAPAFLIVLFEKGLDVSTYTELGNVLASRIATKLSPEGGLEALISAPQTLSSAQLQRLLATPGILRRTYFHQCKTAVVAVETLILPTPSEGVGNA